MEVRRPPGRPLLDPAELAQRKRAILEAALGLIAARGAGAVRLRDVARESAVSVGSLQYYFGSRDQLIREAFRQYARDSLDLIGRADVPAATGWERLTAVLRVIATRPGLTRTARLWMEFNAAGLHDERLRALLLDTQEAWRGLLRRVVLAGVGSGEFRPALAPETVVICLVALIDGFDLAMAAGVEDATSAAIAANLSDAATALLAPGARRPGPLAPGAAM